METWFDHLDEKERARAAFVAGLILFFIESGLQVSGFTSLPLAIGLWGLAGLLFLFWLSHFQWAAKLRGWLQLRMANRRVKFGGIIIAVGLIFWGGMEFEEWKRPNTAVILVPPATPSASSRYYSASEKEDIADAIYKISKHTNSDGITLANTVRMISNSLQPGFTKERIEEMMQQADSSRELVVGLQQGIWDNLINKSPASIIPDLQDVAGSDKPLRDIGTAINNISGGLATLERISNLLDQNHLYEAEEMLHPQRQILYDTSEGIRGWVQQCNERISAMDKRLKQ